MLNMLAVRLKTYGEWYIETKYMLSRFDNIFHNYKVSEFLDRYELKDKSNSQLKCEIDI